MVWQVTGHQRTVRQLDRSLREGKLAHAYLLVGPRHVGKRTLALNLAQGVNCLASEGRPCGECDQCQRIASGRHADVTIIALRADAGEEASRKEIGIDEVREVQRRASLMPFEGRCRVFIFDGAEQMSEEAANALLKTLEEPSPQVLLILLTPREEALLPTIRSRCQRLELGPLPYEEVIGELVRTHSVDRGEAERLARLSRGCLGWALRALREPQVLERRQGELERLVQLTEAGLEERFHYAAELANLFFKNREETKELLYLWLQWWRDILLMGEGAEGFVYNLDWLDTLRLQAGRYTPGQVTGFIKGILATLEALDQNANPRLALEALMLSLPAERRGYE